MVFRPCVILTVIRTQFQPCVAQYQPCVAQYQPCVAQFFIFGGTSPYKMYKTAIHHLSLASLFDFLFMCLISLLFLFSDIFDSYFCNQRSRISDNTLCTSFEDLKKLVIESKAKNTVKKYSYGWNRWKNWANSKFGVKAIPAQP